MSASEKEENKAKELALKKERDEFATLALERGKALEVSQVSCNAFEKTLHFDAQDFMVYANNVIS